MGKKHFTKTEELDARIEAVVREFVEAVKRLDMLESQVRRITDAAATSYVQKASSLRGRASDMDSIAIRLRERGVTGMQDADD